MNKKVISVLCEGPHDVSFLSKLLKINGFKMCEGTKLKDFPPPMNIFLTNEATKADIEELKLSEVKNVLLPSGTLKNEKHGIFFFLYALGGDSRKDKRERILRTFLDSVPRPGEFTEKMSDSDIRIAYFLDADDTGVTERLKELSLEINAALSEKGVCFKKNGEILEYNSLKIGAYIFAESDVDTGKLENIIIPLMKKDNEAIFDDAASYIGRHYDNNRTKKKNFKEEKAIIGIAGQIQRSGTSNNVIINHTDYISKAKVEEHDKCIEISQFLNDLSQ